jgi:alkanesulfonate monooxygenase
MIALAVLIEGAGTHPAAWMHPSSRRGDSTDINYYRRLAQLAERGKFDMFFVADTPATRTSNMKVWSKFPMFMNALEPVTLLSAVAGATSHIGLGATVSTSFFEPYNIARQFASLDHISGGRAAWNVVTSANDFAARNFGHAKLPPHPQRYARARESLAVVNSLWDTWDEDAFVYDKDNATNFDPEKFHVTDFHGDHFTVHGGLNVDRPLKAVLSSSRPALPRSARNLPPRPRKSSSASGIRSARRRPSTTISRTGWRVTDASGPS